MLAGRLGRWVAAAALLTCAVPLQASAQESPVDECAQVGDIAELIMRERQHGATMDDLVRIELRFPAELHGLVEVSSIAAFQFPQRDTEDEREAAVRDFRLWMQDHFCPPEAK